MVRSIIAILFLTTPALALDEPVVWRDPNTGCAYWLAPQGGLAPRYLSDGLPDCPETDARRSTPAPTISDQSVRDMTRELGRGLEALRREVERLQGELQLVRRELEERR